MLVSNSLNVDTQKKGVVVRVLDCQFRVPVFKNYELAPWPHGRLARSYFEVDKVCTMNFEGLGG